MCQSNDEISSQNKLLNQKLSKLILDLLFQYNLCHPFIYYFIVIYVSSLDQ